MLYQKDLFYNRSEIDQKHNEQDLLNGIENNRKQTKKIANLINYHKFKKKI